MDLVTHSGQEIKQGITVKERYTQTYSRLTYETAIVTFLKKDATIRNMLCTRCAETIALCGENAHISMLNRYDNRCGLDNGNMAVVDLVIAEPRQFNIERMIDCQFLGHIDSKDKFNGIVKVFQDFREAYEKVHSMSLDMDTFD